MSDNVLVTGGAGFIGSHLVDYLVEHGRDVTVLDDFSSGKHEHLKEANATGRLRVIDGSVLDTNAVTQAVTSASTVFHLAVQCVRRSLGRPLENHAVNATGTLNVLEASRQHGVEKFIYCSSSEVYGNASDQPLAESDVLCAPATVYGGAKLAGELYTNAYLETYGLPTTVIRPFNAYGAREHDQGDLAEVIPRFVIRVLNGLPPIIFGNGDNSRDFTYVTDVARGLALAEHCSAMIGKTVNVARGESVSIRNVAAAICRACGRPDLTPQMHSPRPGDVHRLHADTRLASSVLGFSADIEFERGLGLYLEWFRDRYPNPSLLLEEDAVNWQMPEAVA